jgi:hypothetical protein
VRTLTVARLFAFIALVMLGVVLVLISCSRSKPMAPKPSPAPRGSLNVQVAPGAYCATKQLGRTFTDSGQLYVCKGPKPYRWRAA